MSAASLVEALERLFAIAALTDEIGELSGHHVDAVNEVADALIHGNAATRDAVTTVLGLGLGALCSMRQHGHDAAGTRWTEEQMEGGRQLVLKLAGGPSAVE